MAKPLVIVSVVVLLIVVVVGGVLVMRGCGGGEEAPPAVVVETPAPEPTPTPTLQEQLSERLKGTTLATSDAIVAELVGELSEHPKLAAWLANEDLVRRFAAAVDNVADGKSPRAHLEFLRPEERFRAIERNGRFTIDPASYRRYDLVAEVFASLDTEGTVTLYRELQPLVREAYREIAPPDRDFDTRLIAAIDQLLAVPVPGAQVEVKPKVVTYTFADPDLEALSDAQRQLLRMGPDNVRTIQAKLRELKAALLAEPEPEQVPAGE
jgi:hypothetical protein